MENNNSIDEQAIEDFETAWTAAPFPNIDDFLPDSSGDTFLGTLLELVIIDLEFRWKQVGATSFGQSFGSCGARKTSVG